MPTLQEMSKWKFRHRAAVFIRPTGRPGTVNEMVIRFYVGKADGSVDEWEFCEWESPHTEEDLIKRAMKYCPLP